MAAHKTKTTTLPKFGVRGTGEALYSGPGILSPHTHTKNIRTFVYDIFLSKFLFAVDICLEIDKQIIQKYVLHLHLISPTDISQRDLVKTDKLFAYAGHLAATDFYETSIEICTDFFYILEMLTSASDPGCTATSIMFPFLTGRHFHRQFRFMLPNLAWNFNARLIFLAATSFG